MECAYEATTHIYDVWLRSDSNGKGLLWFHFRMRNHNNFAGRIKIRILKTSTGDAKPTAAPQAAPMADAWDNQF